VWIHNSAAYESWRFAGGSNKCTPRGRIVAEVIIGLITGDAQSYLRQEPDWTPTYGTNESFTTVDLLKAAHVVAALS
jgi:hypothetical protein